jgi:hypothetical protein
MRCKSANVAEYELKVDRKNYIIILHHDLGMRWSEFFWLHAGGNKNSTPNNSSVRNLKKFRCIKISFALTALYN